MKKLRLYLIFIFLLSCTVYGDFGSWVDSQITGLHEKASKERIDGRVYYGGGRYRYRIEGHGTISLAHVTPPSMSAGCNGVDIDFGGFSYLENGDELLKKLKAIATSALGTYVFKAGLKLVCKECDNIMQDLEDVANMINGLNFDSCQVANQVADYAVNKSINAANYALGEGLVSNISKWGNAPMGALREYGTTPLRNMLKSTGNTIGNAISSLTASEQDEILNNLLGLGSFLRRAMDSNLTVTISTDLIQNMGSDGTTGESRYTGVMRCLAGDILGYDASQLGGTSSYLFDYAPPIAKGSFEKYINDFMENNSSYYCTLKQETNGTIDGDVRKVMFPSGNFKGFRKYFQDEFDSIYSVMSSYGTLSSAQRKFLKQQVVPVYKLMNVAVTLKDKELLNHVSEYIAISTLEHTFNGMLALTSQNVSLYKLEKSAELDAQKKEYFDHMLENLSNASTALNQYVRKAYGRLKINRDMLNTIRSYDRQLKSEVHSRLMTLGGGVF